MFRWIPLAALLLTAACPKPPDPPPPAPDAGTGPCVEHPANLASPGSQLPCELLPPGFTR